MIENALKYTQSGGKIRIISRIRKRKNRQLLQIRVEDNGIGIDERHLSQIFRKYYTANPTTGFGLGLYIAQTIADQIEADITVLSKPDIGSTFELNIPFTHSQDIRPSGLEDETNGEDSSAIMKGLNVLIVEDNPINLLYIKQLL